MQYATNTMPYIIITYKEHKKKDIFEEDKSSLFRTNELVYLLQKQSFPFSALCNELLLGFLADYPSR